MTDTVLKIGPTFLAELQADNPTGEGCGWNAVSGELIFNADNTPGFIAHAQQVLAAHDPDRGVPSAMPDIISDRQCFQQLAMMNKVSQDEALAAVTIGALPKAVSDGIAALPADRQFGARMLLCGATSFERLHPMVPVFLSFFGLNGTTDRDALWTAAAAL